MFMMRFEKYIYSLMRVVAGFTFLWHGSQKLFDLPSSGHQYPVLVHYVAGPIEFFGGLLIMIGLATRWTAFIASGEMAVAYWYAHGTRAILPILNRGELAVLYCFIFLFIAARGGGHWSIDSILYRRKAASDQ